MQEVSRDDFTETNERKQEWPPKGIDWYYSDEWTAIVCGDCRKVMRIFPENSVDSIVTDPPAGISFMNKNWDGDKGGRDKWIDWLTEVMIEAKRVLKPGGHAFVWALPRTSHWTGMALENAGFEIRDCVYHVFGSGFPKNTDISKQIDKRGGQSVGWFGKWLRNWREENNITQKQISILFPSKTGRLTGCIANWELGLNLPTPDQFNLICKTFNLPFESLEEAEREVIGKQDYTVPIELYQIGEDKEGLRIDLNITAPSTPFAKQWSGWGTALKPAVECWWLIRKPLSEKTVAQNVLKWGTGGMNIDGCRVELDGTENLNAVQNGRIYGDGEKYGKATQKHTTPKYKPEGRWPANLIHDGSEEVLELFPNVQTGGGSTGGWQKHYVGGGGIAHTKTIQSPFSGSAARFFYCAKASKSERDAGLEGMEEKSCGMMEDDNYPIKTGSGNLRNTKRFNNHPTVKSITLMKYLCKLVTPPNGIILDPFMGSGSTGKAAILEGFNFIGIEIDKNYVEIAVKRLRQEVFDFRRKDESL